MAFVQDDLRCHVLWSPTERPRLLTQTHLLSEAKVDLDGEMKVLSDIYMKYICNVLHLYQFSVSPVVQDDVLRFEVSVDYPSGMQERQGLDDAAGVEAGGAVIKGAPECQQQEGCQGCARVTPGDGK